MPVSIRHIDEYLYALTAKIPLGIHNGHRRKPKHMTLSRYTKSWPANGEAIRNNREAVYADRVWRNEGARS